MDEAPPYRVIVDRISHEVEYYRGFLKHAALNGTYVINNPFWWTADDKFFNYAVASKLGVAIPKTVLLPQKAYPSDVDILPASLRNLDYPIDWDGLLDYVGRPAILKPYSGGGWKHVYKVNNREELIAAYDGTAPYPMTLQQFVALRANTCAASRSARTTSRRSPTIRTSGAISSSTSICRRSWARASCKRRADDQQRARLRDEHDRVRGEGRRAVRDRLPRSRRRTSSAIASRRSTSIWCSTRCRSW